MNERVSDERLAALAGAHREVKIAGPGAWDGMDLNDVVQDLRDARAELEAAYEAGARDMRERAVQVARAFMLGETMTPEHPESWYRELDALGDAIGNRIAVLPLRAASQEGKP